MIPPSPSRAETWRAAVDELRALVQRDQSDSECVTAVENWLDAQLVAESLLASLQAPSGWQPIETATEKNRRERRAIALSRLNELTTWAMLPFKGDHHSEQNVIDASQTISLLIAEFESEANEAERAASPSASTEQK